MKRRLFMLFVVFLIVSTSIWYWLFRPVLSSAWYDDDYRYRQKILVNNTNTGTTFQKIQYLVNTSVLISAGKMLSTCADVRFTDQNGKALQYFYNSAGGACNTTSTSFYVLIPEINGGTASTSVFMYYGNSQASSASQTSNFSNATFTPTSGPTFLTEETSKGPVLSWSFDQDNATVVKDSTNYQNSGSLGVGTSSPTRVGSDQCVSGNCYLFNGSTSYINRTYSNDTELNASSGSMSISLWFKHPLSAPSQNQQIIGRYSTAGYAIYMKTSGVVCFGIDDDNTWGPDDEACSTTTYNDNIWHHLSAVKTATTIQLYIDGQLIGQDASLVASGSLNGSSTSFFVSSNMPISTFSQTISNTANDGNQWSTWDGVNISAGYWNTSTETAVWNFTNVTIPRGTTITSAILSNTSCGIGNSIPDLIFKGNAIDNASLPSGTNLPRNMIYTSASILYTPSSWVNNTRYSSPDLSTIIQEIINRTGWASGNSLNLILDNNGALGNNDICIYDYSVNTLNSSTLNISYQSPILFAWSGYIDEVKVYPYALSSNQVKMNYIAKQSIEGVTTNMGGAKQNTLSNGQIGYWKLDESSGNVSDSSGNSATLTNNGTITFSGGKFGKAPVMNGSSKYFNITSTISNVQSVAFWVYPTNTTNYYINLNGTTYITSTTGNLSATGFTSPTIYINGESNTTLTTNTWSHVVVTSTAPISGSTFEIGRANSLYLSNLSQIDEVRLYNRALAPSEVDRIYNYAPEPVAYWNFDEKVGTIAYDSSLNNNSTTASTGSPTWTTGKYGSAISFSGINAYVTAPASASLDFEGQQPFSFSVWIKPQLTGGEANPRVFYKERFTSATNRGGYYLDMPNSGTTCFWITNNTNSSSACTTISSNQWTHIAGVYDGSTTSIYKDGIFITSSATYTGGPGTHPTQIFNIGGGSTYSWNGIIDDFKIYNYTRTSKQIIEDMNADHPIVGTPFGGTVANWSFDEGYGTVIHDKVSSLNNLTLSNSTGWTSSGKFGGAYAGANNLRATLLNNSGSFDFVGFEDFTLSSWFKRSSISADEYIYYKQANNAGYTVYMSSTGKIIFGTGGTGTFPQDSIGTNAPTRYDDGVWHHFAGVKNGVNSLKLYIDGNLVDSKVALSGTGSLVNTGTIYVGDRNATDGTDEFLGNLDNLRLYRGALSQSDILADYNQGKTVVLGALSTTSDGSTPSNGVDRSYCVPGDTTTCNPPIGEWKFDDKIGTTALDSSGNNRSGALSNSPTWTTGKYGSALLFNGSSQNVIINPNNGLSATSGSISAWVYPTVSSPTANEMIVEGNRETNRIYLTRLPTTGNLGISLGNNSNIDSGIVIPINTWSYVGMTWNSGTYAIYFNGKNVSTSTYSGLTSLDGYSSIGSYSDLVAPDSWFTGKIDMVRMFNYARTPAQIAWDYNRGQPIGYWKMDECQGNTAHDSSSFGNNGTITIGGTGSYTISGACNSGTATEAWNAGTTGKFNGATALDGTDDYISTSNIALITSNATAYSNVSWGGWFNPSATATSKTLVHKNNEFRLTTNASAYPVCEIYSTTWQVGATSTVALSNSTWTHVMCIYNGTTLETYINGNKIASVARTNVVTSSSATGLNIGRDSAGTGYFAGLIDDVRIYNYALTPQQIQMGMNEGSAVRF
ncbi:MAG: DUF2341 domain-containing protein [Candidatus Roizmanbacteria bacterium]